MELLIIRIPGIRRRPLTFGNAALVHVLPLTDKRLTSWTSQRPLSQPAALDSAVGAGTIGGNTPTATVPSDLNSVHTDLAPVPTDLVAVHTDWAPVHTDFAPVTLINTVSPGS
jgi:hypothetical protein